MLNSNNNINNSFDSIDDFNINSNLTIKKIEELRLRAKKKFIKNLIVFSFIAITIFVYDTYISGEITPSVLFMLLIMSCSLTYLLNYQISKEFKTAYKKYFVVVAMKELCNNVCFDFNKGIEKEKITNVQRIYIGNSVVSNDYVTGVYKGVNFEYSDVHMFNDDYPICDTIFRGQWFIFDFHKRFKANLQVTNDLKKAKYSIQSKPIELEDVEFNDKFKVYAQNDFDAFYILTPNTIEKIKEIHNKIYGRLLFCFSDCKLHIGVNNHIDTFEACIFFKINEEREKERVIRQINKILNFIDILNLDSTLFK